MTWNENKKRVHRKAKELASPPGAYRPLPEDRKAKDVPDHVAVEQRRSFFAFEIKGETIGGVLRRNLGRIRKCYEHALPNNPELQGKLVVKFEIDTQGHVQNFSAAELFG